MKKMTEIVSQDDGTGGEKPANNREYNGKIIDGEVREGKPGDVAIPGKDKVATAPGNVDFRSHPSGTKMNEKTSIVDSWNPAPSGQDINN